MSASDQAARFDVALNNNQALIGERDQRQAAIRAADTRAPIPGALPSDPIKMQLLAHFDSLSPRGKETAMRMIKSLADLCGGCVKGA